MAVVPCCVKLDTHALVAEVCHPLGSPRFLHGLQPWLPRFAIADFVASQQFGFENKTKRNRDAGLALSSI